jgi:uncharacterized protein (DUF2147 family)
VLKLTMLRGDQDVTGRSVALLLTVIASQAVGVQGAEASSVDGTWIIRDLVLDIFDRQNLVCGRIAWMRDPRRRPTECGMTIVWGLASESPSRWTNGSIFDPDDGKTYRLSASLQPDGLLHARIYIGIPLFGQTAENRQTRFTPWKTGQPG